MEEKKIDKHLISAQKGDNLAREEIINSHREFIARVSSRVCNRYLTWDNDDEISIALLAFNEAIDNYKADKGTSFHTFAQTVIRRRLVDYFRKESKHQHLSLSPMDPDDEELSRYDMEKSKGMHFEAEKQEFLGQVVEDYIEVLGQYGVTLDDLVKVSPKHKDTKENLMKIAMNLASQANLMEYLTRNKLLPIKEMELLTGVKRKVIEKNRRYLIALVLIITEPRFYPLKSFTQLPEITQEEKVTFR